MFNVILDDVRELSQVESLLQMELKTSVHKTFIVRTSTEFIELISDRGVPVDGIIFLDNDLGEEMEGYDCLKWLIEKCLDEDLDLPMVLVHSQNTVAQDNMRSSIIRYHKYRKSLKDNQ